MTVQAMMTQPKRSSRYSKKYSIKNPEEVE